MEWKAEYEIGESKIDAQHRTVIGLINQLMSSWHNCSHEALSDILAEMTEYAHEHLAYEEHVMADCGYPELESHKVKHRQYVRQTAKMCMQAVRDTQQAPDRIFDFLMQWWDRHILQEDQLYKPYLKQ